MMLLLLVVLLIECRPTVVSSGVLFNSSSV